MLRTSFYQDKLLLQGIRHTIWCSDRPTSTGVHLGEAPTPNAPPHCTPPPQGLCGWWPLAATAIHPRCWFMNRRPGQKGCAIWHTGSASSFASWVQSLGGVADLAHSVWGPHSSQLVSCCWKRREGPRLSSAPLLLWPPGPLSDRGEREEDRALPPPAGTIHVPRSLKPSGETSRHASPPHTHTHWRSPYSLKSCWEQDQGGESVWNRRKEPVWRSDTCKRFPFHKLCLS